jgi:hypothetical protein
MKRYYIISILFIVLFVAVNAQAQGGIGAMPREDIVKLRAVVRDSLSDEVYHNVLFLKECALGGMTDSAAQIIAYDGGKTKTGRWSRAVNMQDSSEKARVLFLMEKLKKMFTDMPDMVREYYAVFVDKDNPAGQKHLYQISLTNGKKKKMTSFTFFPIGEKMMLGEVY